MTFIVTGFVKQGPKYFFSNINPSGVPLALKFLVIPIEFFSKYLLRPLTLAVRLFANMTAGHVLLAIFAIMTNELLVKHNSGRLPDRVRAAAVRWASWRSPRSSCWSRCCRRTSSRS